MAVTSLNVDGPQSASYTKDVAETVAEAVRVLNHVTAKSGALDYPSDVYEVIGSLSRAVFGLDQLCRQLSRWLVNEYQAGRLSEWPEGRHGGDTDAAMTNALDELDHAVAAIRVAASHLDQAHGITSAFEAKLNHDVTSPTTTTIVDLQPVDLGVVWVLTA